MDFHTLTTDHLPLINPAPPKLKNIPSSYFSTTQPHLPPNAKQSLILNMSKSIAGLKLDLSSHKPSTKSSTLSTSVTKTQGHKSFDKPLASKIVPKLHLSINNSRDSKDFSTALTSSRSNLKAGQSSLNTSRILKDSNSRQSITKRPQSKEVDSKLSTFPMSSSAALRIFKSHLTLWEQGEILDHSQIYYIGQKSCKVKSFNGANNGFDDERNDYKAQIGDHIAYRYEIIQVLGKGSFGQVFKVMDHKNKEFQALKIIRNKARFHQQGAVEVKVLQMLKNLDREDKNHVIHIKEAFCFRDHLCITFEILSINLYELLKSNGFNGLSLSLIQRFTFQLLSGLKLAKDQKIIHCDLKPENILLKQSNKSCIKIIDFGSSCFEDQRVFSYIQSRFYRAPEIILGLPYSSAIDMWSLGCILVELYTGVPLFPGENELDQLLCMMEVLGLPPESLMKTASRTKIFFDNENRPKIVPNSRGKKRFPGSKHLNDVILGTDKNFQDFVARCLEWNPLMRLTPEQGLAHCWIKAIDNVLVTPRSRRMSLANDAQGLNSSGMLNTVRNNQRAGGMGPAASGVGKVGVGAGSAGNAGNAGYLNGGNSNLAKFTSVMVGNNSTRHSKTSSFVFV